MSGRQEGRLFTVNSLADLRTDGAKQVRIARRWNRQELCSVGDTLRAWSKSKTTSCPPDLRSSKRKAAFTLAEVLITLGIVGVVAVVVMPLLLNNINERIRIRQDTDVKYKLTQATDKMKSLGLLTTYSSTDAFVDELQRHLKIIKRCDSSNLSGCWPSEIVYGSDGEEYNINELKKGVNLGFSERKTDNVGIVLSNGYSLLLSYDDKCIATYDPATTYSWTNDVYGTPVTNATTSCISAIFDVNGGKKPNKETLDIRSLNGAKISRDCIRIGSDVCVALEDTVYSPIDMSDPNYMEYVEKTGIPACVWNGSLCGGYDGLMGAAMACYNVGKRLPTEAELHTIAAYIYNDPHCAGKSYDFGTSCFSKLQGTINDKLNMSGKYYLAKYKNSSMEIMTFSASGTRSFTDSRNYAYESYFKANKVRCVQ